MAKIKQLPIEVITKIAAGQIVERPASIIKELVENALDAKATHIIVELESAGKKKIIVTDNGLGMLEADLELCFQHHTTSKIFNSDDLLHITSFGFRGEALSSIVASAQVRIESKQETELAGKYIELVDGMMHRKGSVGMPTGTRVTVSGLFSKIPARKKFLKANTTEFAHILQVITQQALAHASVAFTVIHNKKVVIELPANQELLERATELLSEQVSENLLPIKILGDHFKITGFIGKPQIGTQSKNRQFLFVNNRSVYSKEIAQKIKEVFSTLLEPKSYPAFLLHLELSPDLVDVNIDPQKTQVKFTNLSEIIKALETEIQNVLEQANLTYSQRGSNGFYDEYTMDAGIAKIVRNQSDGWNIKDAELIEDTEVLQVHNLYLVAQTKRGVLIVDQHAAHERILYQEFLEKFNQKRFETIELDQQIKLDFPKAELVFLKTQLKTFTDLGFEIVQKKDLFFVTAIPIVFKTRNIQRLIQELLHDCINATEPKEIDVGTHRTIAYLACRTAIKAGEKLTAKERKRLLEKLLQTDEKYTCPHGRPVEVELDILYLDQLFKRVK